MDESPSPLALIVGASRGLGLGLARELLSRGWDVIATTRSGSHEGLQTNTWSLHGTCQIEKLEMTDVRSIEALKGRLSDRHLDLLFVNAGIANGPDDRVDRISDDDFTRLMLTNALAPMRVIEMMEDLVVPDGTIGIMSSSMGSIGLNDRGGWEVYRASKAALNMLMASYAARNRDSSRPLVLMDPGWVRTDMGGQDATLAVEESVSFMAETIEKQKGQRGLRYINYRGDVLPW